MSVKGERPTPEAFLAPFPSDIQAIARELRTLIQGEVAGLREAVYTGWGLIGYRARRGSRDFYFAYIFPTPEYVDLGFEFGRLLADPKGILQGNGRQVRYVRLTDLADIKPGQLIPLIRAAVEVAALTRAEKKQLFLAVAAADDSDPAAI